MNLQRLIILLFVGTALLQTGCLPNNRETQHETFEEIRAQAAIIAQREKFYQDSLKQKVYEHLQKQKIKEYYESLTRDPEFDTIDVHKAFEELQFYTIRADHSYRFSNYLHIYFEFIYPLKDTLPINRIKEQITREFFRCQNLDMKGISNEKMVDVAMGYYFKKAIDDRIKIDLDEACRDEIYSKVRIVNDNVFVYMIRHVYSWGYLHPIEQKNYYNYFMPNGRKISLADLFSKENQPDVLELIKSKLRENSPPPHENSAFLTENFMILPQEIVFSYNPYEIASYSAGYFRFNFKYDQFKHLLKPAAHRYFIDLRNEKK